MENSSLVDMRLEFFVLMCDRIMFVGIIYLFVKLWIYRWLRQSPWLRLVFLCDVDRATLILKVIDMKLRLLVKGKELLYIVVALIIGIVIGTMIVIKSYNYNCLGTVADWMSAIMSFVAILVVFWQVKRESQNERAFYIENKRPRFSVERTTVINSNEKILYHNSYGNLKTLYKKLHDEEHPRYIIRLTNISDSIVHSLKIILKYNSEELNGYAFSGLTSKQSLLLVPDEELSNGGFIDL